MHKTDRPTPTQDDVHHSHHTAIITLLLYIPLHSLNYFLMLNIYVYFVKVMYHPSYCFFIEGISIYFKSLSGNAPYLYWSRTL